MLTVILPLLGGKEEAKKCVDYLRIYYAGAVFERVIAYGGTAKEAEHFLRLQPDIRLCSGAGKPLGTLLNEAVQQARGEAVLFVSPNYILLQPALQNMMRVLQENERAAMALPVSDSNMVGADSAQAFEIAPAAQLPYDDAAGLSRFVAEIAKREMKIASALLVRDFCFLMKREVFLSLGGFSSGYQTEMLLLADLSLRAWEEGFSCLVARSAYVHINPYGYPSAYGEDCERFSREHGLRLEYSFNARRELLGMMDIKKTGIHVLEVGCACGATLLAVRDANPTAELYGIEFDEKPARLAAHFAKVEALDVETLERAEWQERFDYIILGDVIEHLREPWQAMKNLAALLKPGGHVVVSIPNVMHVSVFSMMLQGRWRYEEAGILDRTHLRFFTLAEIVAMLRGAALEPQQITMSRVSENEQETALAERLAALLPQHIDPVELHAYQWKILARKKEQGEI